MLSTGLAAALFAALTLAPAAHAGADPAPGTSSGAVRLAGLLPCTSDVLACWPWSGAWVFPVGDSLEFGRECAGEPGYRVNRGVLTRAADGETHDGADLANGQAGGIVRAAGSGLVVAVEPTSRGDAVCSIAAGAVSFPPRTQLEPDILQIRADVFLVLHQGPGLLVKLGESGTLVAEGHAQTLRARVVLPRLVVSGG